MGNRFERVPGAGRCTRVGLGIRLFCEQIDYQRDRIKSITFQQLRWLSVNKMVLLRCDILQNFINVLKLTSKLNVLDKFNKMNAKDRTLSTLSDRPITYFECLWPFQVISHFRSVSGIYF